jgi:ABC-2 type transport system ATP-binding protein
VIEVAQDYREVIVSVDELKKSFDQTPLFDSISFKIYQGSFTTILGLNGVGKSSLLNILCNRLTPDEGHGHVLGRPIGTDLAEERLSLALVSEYLNYEIGASTREFSRYYGALFRHFDWPLFDRFCEVRKIDLNKHFSQYSRGQKMQFCLILAMAQRPKILFIDEVTSVLDYKAREFFLTELKQYCDNGGTVVLTTNIINEVQQYSTDLVIIQNSKEVVSGPQHKILEQFLRIRVFDTSPLPHHVRESALYLGKDQDGANLMVLSKAEWDELEADQRAGIEVNHPNLHEVFSLLTQQL